MPLTNFLDDTGYRPMFLCDHCGKQITDPGLANVLWDGEFNAKDIDKRTPEIVWIVHKECNDQFKEGQRVRHFCWDQLDWFLLKLLGNTGFTQEKQRKCAKYMVMLGDLTSLNGDVQ